MNLKRLETVGSPETGNKSNSNPIDYNEPPSDKEQPCLCDGREQEVHQAEPDNPMPFPLTLPPISMYIDSNRLMLAEPEFSKVETTPEEKQRVVKALGLILQAHCALHVKGAPYSLDPDMAWDWRQMKLSAREYGAFAYAICQHTGLKDEIRDVPYDWTPLNGLEGILGVRKKVPFQSQLTRTVSGVIINAMCENDLLMSLTNWPSLVPQRHVSVLTGTIEGMRTPCRSFLHRHKKEDWDGKEEDEPGEDEGGWNSEDEKNASPVTQIADFVLEVGVGEKARSLRMLAHSYIERGTLCVMTVSVERQGEYDFDWSYSLYRRGEARRVPGQVTLYEIICAAQDARVEMTEDGNGEFPAGLTLFDFVPPNVLEENGVTSPTDEKAVLKLRMSLEELEGTRSTLSLSGFGCDKLISQHLQDVYEFL